LQAVVRNGSANTSNDGEKRTDRRNLRHLFCTVYLG
jgi:hypothetical protein